MQDPKYVTCPEVFDTDSRQIIRTSELLGPIASPEAHQLRMRVEEIKQTGKALFTCPLCAKTLSLRAYDSANIAMHFAHPRDPEHKCPYKSDDKSTPEELAAMKYNGLKETQDHRNVKYWILSGLRMDKTISNDSIKSEKRYKAKLPDKSWRQPDVSAVWNNKTLVFEAQLATTFVTIIANRRNFYSQNGVQLIWVFAKSPENELLRFTSKDIFFNNNYNLFVVNTETHRESLKRGMLVLQAWWPSPHFFQPDANIARWSSKLVTLDELTFNIDKRTVFYFDFDSYLQNKITAIERKDSLSINVQAATRATTFDLFQNSFESDIEQITNQKKISINDSLNQLLIAKKESDSTQALSIFQGYINSNTWPQNERLMQTLMIGHMVELGGRFAFTEDTKKHIKGIVCALYSLSCGVPTGTNHSSLKELESYVYDVHLCHYLLFLRGVVRFKREKELDTNNLNSTVSKHKERFKKMRNELDEDDPLLFQDRSLDTLIELIFPELAQDTKKIRMTALKRKNLRIS